MRGEPGVVAVQQRDDFGSRQGKMFRCVPGYQPRVQLVIQISDAFDLVIPAMACEGAPLLLPVSQTRNIRGTPGFTGDNQQRQVGPANGGQATYQRLHPVERIRRYVVNGNQRMHRC